MHHVSNLNLSTGSLWAIGVLVMIIDYKKQFQAITLLVCVIIGLCLMAHAGNPSPAYTNVGNGCQRMVVNYDTNDVGSTWAVVCFGYFQSKIQKTPIIYWGSTLKKFMIFTTSGAWICGYSTNGADQCGNGYYSNYGDLGSLTNATFAVVENWSGSGYDAIFYFSGTVDSPSILQFYIDGGTHLTRAVMGTGQ